MVKKLNKLTTNIATIKLKGGYVTYPSGWVVLDDVCGPAEDCRYAGVVEFHNSTGYGIPHFLFFCDTQYEVDYSDELIKRVKDACAKAYPDLKRYLDTPLPSLAIKDAEDRTKWADTPSFGIFSLPVEGDPALVTTTPVLSAKIVRNS